MNPEPASAVATTCDGPAMSSAATTPLVLSVPLEMESMRGIIAETNSARREASPGRVRSPATIEYGPSTPLFPRSTRPWRQSGVAPAPGAQESEPSAATATALSVLVSRAPV